VHLVSSCHKFPDSIRSKARKLRSESLASSKFSYPVACLQDSVQLGSGLGTDSPDLIMNERTDPRSHEVLIRFAPQTDVGALLSALLLIAIRTLRP